MAARGASLRDKQIASLKKILNLNEDVEAGDNDESHANGLATSPIAWKVLVFDDLGQEYECHVLSRSSGALCADVEGLQCHQLRSEGQRSPEPGGHDTSVRYAHVPVNVERI